MKKQISIKEIKAKLKWFHGEEFEKYPFIDETDNSKNDLNKAC